jgi:hypothetical protein
MAQALWAERAHNVVMNTQRPFRAPVLAALLALSAGVPRASAQLEFGGILGTPSVLFDGARAHGAIAAPGAVRAFAARGAADPDGLDANQRALLNGLLSRVQVKPGADPRAPGLLHQTFVRLVRTRTGAEMAARFIGENARAVVQFGAMESAAVTVVNGKAVLLYSGGATDVYQHPPVVTLNSGYLNSDPTWRGPEMTGTLGHEMFGHALQSQRAATAGASDAYHHYRGDEANAGLIGWLIEMEAGGPADNGHMWTYLRDPEAYHRNLETMMAYYAGTFSVEELKDPLAALKARRGAIEAARQALHLRRDAMDVWRPVIDHFVNVHKMPSSSFSSMREDIARVDDYTKTQDVEFGNMTRYIDALSQHWRTDQAPELTRMKREAGSSYFAGTEARLKELRERVRQETANRRPEPSIPPVPGQITFDQLAEMLRKDQSERPDHWRR